MRRSISAKLMTSFLIGAAITVLVGAVSVVVLDKANDVANSTIDVHMQDMMATRRLRNIMTDALAYEREFILFREIGDLTNEEELVENLEDAWT